MTDQTTPATVRIRNALTLEQFYRLCEWLKRTDLEDIATSLEHAAICARAKLEFNVTAANFEKAAEVTGVKMPFVIAKESKAQAAAKLAAAQKAGPRLLAALRALLHECTADGVSDQIDQAVSEEAYAACDEAEAE